MSYIDRTLGRNEELLYRAHFHWLMHAAGWCALLAAIAVAVVIYDLRFPWGALVVLLIGVVLWLTILGPIWTTEVGVTSQRLIFKQGFIRRTTNELQLRAIEEVSLHQGILGRIFGFGNVQVHGTGVDDISLPVLADPLGLRRALQDAIGAAVQIGAGGELRSRPLPDSTARP
jgi:membrane protein YdbS with pleckstrin-like domain